MKPGEFLIEDGDIVTNANRKTITIEVSNTGDRPIQVGSHFHFYEVNNALAFDREAVRGMRLNIPSGVTVRFEPGDTKTIELTELRGTRTVFGLNNRINGSLDGA